MKNAVKLLTCVSVIFTLNGCHSDKPSLSEARAPFEAWVSDCKYVTLTDFNVINGRKAGDAGHLLEIRYSLRLQLEDSQINGLKDWAEKKHVYEQEHNDSLTYDSALVTTGVIPNRDAGSVARWNRWSAALAELNSALFPWKVQQQILKSCPNTPEQVVDDLISKGHWNEMRQNTLTFRKDQLYVLTDNGWMAAASPEH